MKRTESGTRRAEKQRKKARIRAIALSDSMTGCLYCKQFNQGYSEFKGQNLGNRILLNTKNFIVFPSLGQIVEGYLLIATREHYISMGSIPQKLYAELEDVKERVERILGKEYRCPLFFEHGPASPSKRGGCCVEHAHIHAVPTEVDVLEKLVAMQFTAEPMISFSSLGKKYESNMPYLFLEDNFGRRYIFECPEAIPSQLIRKIIAVALGKPEQWDWREYPEIEKLKKTLERLKGKF